MQQKPLRHAYLIITHGSFPLLEAQLRFLDSENADFFIHLDARVKDFDFDHYRAVPRRSRVTFVDRVKISWGHYSLVECELNLLRAAAAGEYDYYHLLSGVDLPVKSRRYIEEYFLRFPGRNYLNYQMETLDREYGERVRFYHPFQRWNIRNRVLRTALRRGCNSLQRLAGVDRRKAAGPDYVFQKGAQWWSLTNDAVRCLLDREGEIYERFHSAFCPDEMFAATVLYNSPLRDTLSPGNFRDDYRCCLRYIDWTRGKPYTFTDADFEELIHTPPEFLFARKFDCVRCPALAERLLAHFSEDN